MKSTYLFQDQVSIITAWFRTWNECEQTVALYSLINKLTHTQARFLSLVLSESLKDVTELHKLEAQANSVEYVSNLCNEAKDTAVTELLQRLPLLNQGNVETKAEYMKLIPKILAHSIEHGVHIEESRQLLSYSLIHPAMSGEERAHLSVWLGHLEERFAEDSAAENKENSGQVSHLSDAQVQYHHQLQSGNWSQEVPKDNAGYVTNVKVTIESLESGNMDHHVALSKMHPPIHATLSGPPQFNSGQMSSHNINPPQEGLHRPLGRSYSVTPPSSVTDWLNDAKNRHSNVSSSSSSDLQLDECQGRNTFVEEDSGMKDVPAWLKSLRLHKYATLFQQLTYKEMTSLTEEWLEVKGVTKGARHKIVLSIKQLNERQNTLKMLEKDIMEGGDLKAALSEMKAILATPIRGYKLETEEENMMGSGISPNSDYDVCEGDIPGQFTRVMGKVCTQLLVTSRQDDECFNIYMQLIDKCVNHEAFTPKQKKLLLTWKQSINRIWHPQSQRHPLDKQRKAWGNTFPLNVQKAPMQGRPVRGAGGKTGVQWTFNKRPLPVQAINSSGALPLYNTLPPPFIPQSGLLQEPKQALHRTHSAPVKTPQSGGQRSGPTEPEVNARLDDLCLSMTEAALGGMDKQ